MFETICDINRINYADPIYYTKSFLHNPYVKANDLAKHIHLYNKHLTDFKYYSFINLKGSINKLTETKQEQFFDGVVRSGPFETTRTCYTFQDNHELIQLTKDNGGSKRDWILFDSLKKPNTLRVLTFVNDVLISHEDISFNAFLEYERIGELPYSDDSLHHQERNRQRTTKYGFRSGKETQKIHYRNNSDEQSKSIITYNEEFMILSAKAHSQKDKSVLLYEAEFIYDADNVLNKIIYTRHKPTRYYAGNVSHELCFEYDDKGRLIRFTKDFHTITWEYDEHDNPIYIEESNSNGGMGFEARNSYKYDDQGNWIYRRTHKLRVQSYRSVLIRSAEINRQIEYFR